MWSPFLMPTNTDIAFLLQDYITSFLHNLSPHNEPKGKIAFGLIEQLRFFKQPIFLHSTLLLIIYLVTPLNSALLVELSGPSHFPALR